MSYKLFQYQEAAITNLTSAFRAGKKRVVLCLPTGAGKTVIFAHIAKLSAEKGKKVIILAHRKELFSQAYDKLTAMGLTPTKFSADEKNPSRLTVAMVETAKRNAEKLRAIPFDLVIIDEAHMGNFNAIFDMWPNAWFVGLTATPLSAKKDSPMKDLWNEVVVGAEIPQLVELGRLAKVTTYAPRLIDTRKMKVAMGEYTEESMMSEFDRPIVYDGVIDEYRNRANGKKALVFCVNITHTAITAEKFRAAGYDARSLDSTNSDEERTEVLSWYEKTSGAILVNCSILTTGFDSPSTEVIIINRATTSVTLYLQMVGRGSRVTDDKSQFIVIDAGECYKRCGGTWDTPRDWSDTFHNPPVPKRRKEEEEEEEKKSGKICLVCSAVIPSGNVCKLCGYKFPTQEIATARAVAGFEAVRPTKASAKKEAAEVAHVHFQFLRAQQIATGKKVGWIYYRLMDDKKHSQEVVKLMLAMYAKLVARTEISDRQASARAGMMMKEKVA